MRPANRPFPSSKKSHFQNEAKCETFVVKMSFICMIIKNHFHINGFALSLALKVRLFRTRSEMAYVFSCLVIDAFNLRFPAFKFSTFTEVSPAEPFSLSEMFTLIFYSKSTKFPNSCQLAQKAQRQQTLPNAPQTSSKDDLRIVFPPKLQLLFHFLLQNPDRRIKTMFFFASWCL